MMVEKIISEEFPVITIETVGGLHNNLLGSYLKSYLPITAKNYKQQVPLALDIFGVELSKIFQDDRLKFFPSILENGIINMYERLHLNPNLTLFSAFNSSIEDLAQKTSIIPISVQKYIANLAGIIFCSKNVQTDVEAFKRNLRTTSYIEDELILGSANIAISSYQFWSSRKGNSNPSGLIGGDCVGFLAGWASTVLSEWHDHGSLSVYNSSYRLGQGAIWGAAGSVVLPFLAPKAPTEPKNSTTFTQVSRPRF